MNNLRTRYTFALVGRILLCCVFLVSAYAKITEWSVSEHMMAAKGIPFAPLLLDGAIIIELLGGLSLLTGFLSRYSALILFLYLIPVTILFHNFWEVAPALQSLQFVNFLKNLAIMGGLLQLVAFGPGRYSLERERYLYPFETEAARSRGGTTASGVR